MAYEPVSQHLSQNPDPQIDGLLENDITHPQEQQIIPNQPPKSLVDWLVRVHLRLMALDSENARDAS